MITYLAFLRGINVGGHNKIPMQDLRTLLSDIGLKYVKTYIQTGNVVFKTYQTDIQKLTLKIENAITENFQFTIPVLIKTPEDISNLLSKCPFNQTEKESSYFALLFNDITETQNNLINTFSFPNEKFEAIKDCIYLYSSTGYSRAKANNNFFEKKIKLTATTRNYKTLVKMISLSEG